MPDAMAREIEWATHKPTLWMDEPQLPQSTAVEGRSCACWRGGCGLILTFA
jgi:hypothetical protein